MGSLSFLVFPLAELPEMARGKGVRLQKYKDGGLSDLRVFAASTGLTWPGGVVIGPDRALYVTRNSSLPALGDVVRIPIP